VSAIISAATLLSNMLLIVCPLSSSIYNFPFTSLAAGVAVGAGTSAVEAVAGAAGAEPPLLDDPLQGAAAGARASASGLPTLPYVFSSSFSALAVECVYISHAAALANIAPNVDADTALAGYPNSLAAGLDGNEASAPLIWPRLLVCLCARARAAANTGASAGVVGVPTSPTDFDETSDFVSSDGRVPRNPSRTND
jgi:hypothetical protein